MPIDRDGWDLRAFKHWKFGISNFFVKTPISDNAASYRTRRRFATPMAEAMHEHAEPVVGTTAPPTHPSAPAPDAHVADFDVESHEWRAMHTQASLQHALRSSRFFNHASPKVATETAARIGNSMMPLGTAAPADAQLVAGQRLLALELLSQATKRDAGLAADVLKQLSQMDTAAEIKRVYQLKRRTGDRIHWIRNAHTQRVYETLWSFVSKLAVLPAGPDIIAALQGGRGSSAKQRDMELMFKAVSALRPRRPTRMDPASLLEATRDAGSIPEAAVQCAMTRIADDGDGAPYMWALNAVKNDLHESGPGTDFAAIESRLGKFGTWLQRAIPRSQATTDRSGDDASEKSSARTDSTRRWPRVSMAKLNPLGKKTPFFALSHGAQHADRATAALERAKFEHALRSSMARLNDASARVEEQELQRRKPGKWPDALLLRATLDHCLERSPPDPLDNYRFGARQIEDIARRAVERLKLDGIAANAQDLEKHPWLRRLRAAPLTVERVERWAADHAFKSPRKRLSDFAPWRNASPQSSAEPLLKGRSTTSDAEAAEAFADDVAEAKQALYGRKTEPMDWTPQGISDALKSIVGNMQSSSRVTLSGGGLVGVGTKGITGSFTQWLTSFVFRFRVDLRAMARRRALLEVNSSSYSMDLTLATQHGKLVQFGAGASAGPNLHIASLTGGGDAVGYRRDAVRTSSITFRFSKTHRSHGEVRQDMQRLIDWLIKASTAPQDKREPLLPRLLGEFPHLSISRNGLSDELRRGHGAKIEGRATFTLPYASPVAEGGVYADYQPKIRRRHSDRMGAMQIDKRFQGQEVRVGAEGAIGLRTYKQVGDPAAGQRVNIGTLEGLNVGFDFLNGTASVRSEIVREHGQVLKRSYREVEFQNADGLKKVIERDRGDWIDAVAARRSIAHDQAAEDLDRFVARMSADTTPNHSVAARWELKKGCARLVDTYASLASVYRDESGSRPPHAVVGTVHPRAAEQPTKTDRFDRAARRVLDDPRAYRPSSLRMYERMTKQDDIGFRLGFQAGRSHRSDGVHAYQRLI